MKISSEISSDEMVASFLKAEINSPRWRSLLLQIIATRNIDLKIIENPDTRNQDDNLLRKSVLSEFRGYEKNDHIFSTFPTNVIWFRAALTFEELLKVKYMRYEYWDELSQHSRLPIKAVETILNNEEIFGESNQQFFDISRLIKDGMTLPELIIVSKSQTAPLVVLEGHLRLTAMVLAKQKLPKELEVILGISPQMDEWDGY